MVKIFEQTYGPIKRDPLAAFRPTQKRERPDFNAEQWEIAPEYLLVDGYNIIFAWDELNAPVSYTHLDVYKRQQVQAAVEALTESGVGDGLVPVHIGGAVGVVLLVVEVHGVGRGAGALLTELAVVFVAGVGGNGGDGALVQVDLVQLAVLVELECDSLIGDHGHGQTLEAADIGLSLIHISPAASISS